MASLNGSMNQAKLSVIEAKLLLELVAGRFASIQDALAWAIRHADSTGLIRLTRRKKQEEYRRAYFAIQDRAERWKTVPGFESLQASTHGRIRKASSHDICLPSLNSRLYAQVNFREGGQQRPQLIHRLVALAFCRKNLGADTVNHRDKYRLNNSASNLEWLTVKENLQHSANSGGHGRPRKRFSSDSGH